MYWPPGITTGASGAGQPVQGKQIVGQQDSTNAQKRRKVKKRKQVRDCGKNNTLILSWTLMERRKS